MSTQKKIEVKTSVHKYLHNIVPISNNSMYQ